MPVSISGTTGYAGPLGAITVDTGSIVANAVTPAKMSRTGSSGQVLTSNGAGADPSYTSVSAVTSITAGGGLTGGTITSTGTIAVDTTHLAIGTYAILYCFSRSNTAPGSTAVPASSLGYATNGVANGQFGLGGAAIRLGNVTVPGAAYVAGAAPNTSAVSGTWRLMSSQQTSTFVCCFTYAYPALYVRVS